MRAEDMLGDPGSDGVARRNSVLGCPVPHHRRDLIKLQRLRRAGEVAYIHITVKYHIMILY